MDGYNSDIVPIKNENSSLKVKLDVTLSQILEVVSLNWDLNKNDIYHENIQEWSTRNYHNELVVEFGKKICFLIVKKALNK